MGASLNDAISYRCPLSLEPPKLFYFPMRWNLPQPFDPGVLERDVRIEALGDGAGDEVAPLLLEQLDYLLLLRHQRIDLRCLSIKEQGDCALLRKRRAHKMCVGNALSA